MPSESLNLIQGDFDKSFSTNIENFKSPVRYFRDYLKVCSEFSAVSDIKEDAIEFTKFYARKTFLRVPDEFYMACSDQDLIEIYNTENIQIFRTFNFFNITTYSISELLLNDWPSLYYRPHEIMDELIEANKQVYATNRMILLDTPEHDLVEIKSEAKSISRVKFKCLAPVYKGVESDISGFIVASSARRVYPQGDGDGELRYV